MHNHQQQALVSTALAGAETADRRPVSRKSNRKKA
jgi:hypothetical protein